MTCSLFVSRQKPTLGGPLVLRVRDQLAKPEHEGEPKVLFLLPIPYFIYAQIPFNSSSVLFSKRDDSCGCNSEALMHLNNANVHFFCIKPLLRSRPKTNNTRANNPDSDCTPKSNREAELLIMLILLKTAAGKQ